MKIKIENEKLVFTIAAISFALISILIFLFLIIFYRTHSPDTEYITHNQFYEGLILIGVAFFSGILAVALEFSGKLADFAKELGEIKGTLNQYISNEKKRK